MDQIVGQLISSGPVGIICAAVVYIIIATQRNATKKSRDCMHDEMDKRVSLLESKVDKIDELDLAERLAAIETSLKYIQMLLENKK